jgi:glucans biosynthesis protein
VRPEPAARTLTIYALLDSPGVAGAYRFDLRPGAITQVEVAAKLYARHGIEKIGIGTLTSMFLFGEDPSGRRFDDFRPEVHDSDGLMVQTGSGEWLWRPLGNPRDLRVTSFQDESPRGFGLVQRDRVYDHYQDNESRFDLRPSYWVEPLGRWGKGRIELMEIPSNEEIHDNVSAYWVPATPVAAGKPMSFSYLLSSFINSPRWPPGGRVVSTRTGTAFIAGYGRERDGGKRRIVIDFAGGDLAGLDKTQPVKANVTASSGTIDAVTIEQLDDGQTWRAAFRLNPAGDRAVDLRCYLSLYGEALTETWTYPWTVTE